MQRNSKKRESKKAITFRRKAKTEYEVGQTMKLKFDVLFNVAS